MKKFAIITVTVGLIGALSAGAYAYYSPRSGGDTSQETTYGPARKQSQSIQGRGQGNRGMYQAQNVQTAPARNQAMQGRGRGNHSMYQVQNASARQGWKQGRGMRANRGNGSFETFPCTEYGRWNNAQPGWRAQAQDGTAPRALELITEAEAKEVAETHIDRYLPGYTVDSIEQDTWRPLYFVTLKGENDAVQQLVVHGFAGQVMNVFPQSAE